MVVAQRFEIGSIFIREQIGVQIGVQPDDGLGLGNLQITLCSGSGWKMPTRSQLGLGLGRAHGQPDPDLYYYYYYFLLKLKAFYCFQVVEQH